MLKMEKKTIEAKLKNMSNSERKFKLESIDILEDKYISVIYSETYYSNVMIGLRYKGKVYDYATYSKIEGDKLAANGKKKSVYHSLPFKETEGVYEKRFNFDINEQWFCIGEKIFDDIGTWSLKGSTINSVKFDSFDSEGWKKLVKNILCLVPEVGENFKVSDYNSISHHIDNDEAERRAFTSHVRKRMVGYMKSSRSLGNLVPDVKNDNSFLGYSSVYILSAEINGTLYHKIGKADDIEGRKESIERSCGIPHNILAFKNIQNDKTSGRMAVKFEKGLHSAYAMQRVIFDKVWDGSTEYFKLSKKEINRIIKECKFTKYK